MKIGFNEGTSLECKGHSLQADLDLCEKNGFDFIDVRFDCLNDYLASGKTLQDLAAWFDSHHLKPLSYNALCFFNMKQTQKEKDDVIAELKDIVEKCRIIKCPMVVVVPSFNIPVDATRREIRDDAVRMLKEMLKYCEPVGLKLSLEFCGAPGMSINNFEDAYEVVKAVDSPLMGVTLDQYHFHAMASTWESLEKADGGKIFVWHLNDMEDLPCGAAYNTDAKRLWPGDPQGCLDHKRYADTLKKIGFNGDVCTMEVFRPEYYKLSLEDNVSTAAAKTKGHVKKYW
jgi:Sugar phosphate isomerases/epimerases